MPRVLVGGLGNVFLGDDGFGVEVVRQLMRHDLPEAVQIADFGIRSYDLAYAMMDDYDAVILVDATQRGQPPGTLYLIEPALDDRNERDETVVNGHSMDPVRALHLVQRLGGTFERPLYLVACEPAVLETENGRLGLSKPVHAAVPHAVERIRSLVRALLSEEQNIEPVNEDIRL